MLRPQRRRLRWGRVLLFVSGGALCCVYALTLSTWLASRSAGRVRGPWTAGGVNAVRNVRTREVTAPVNRTPEGGDVLRQTTQPPLVIVNRTDIEQCVYVEPPNATPAVPTVTSAGPLPATAPPPSQHRKGDYPEDLFSVEQRKQGWVVLHVLGMVYMFISLAIVCDEFFVPALGVITDTLKISDDVAGATFMAAGGSAPELFTALIGVFVSHSNVGIGTIVGSAVFNILFVIGMCAIFSREMLHLTWWPLFRDVSFYIVDLVMLIVFFLDSTIVWWESVMLVTGYLSYVTFMKFNIPIEQAVKGLLGRHVGIVKVWSAAEQPGKEREPNPPPPLAPPPPALPAPPPAPKEVPSPTKVEAGPAQVSPLHQRLPSEHLENRTRLKVRPILQRGGSIASLHNTSLRSTIFQLMIHTLDPLGEEAGFRGDVQAVGAGRARRETSFNGDVGHEVPVKRKARNKVKPLNPPVRGTVESKTKHRPPIDAEHGPEPKSDQASLAGGQEATAIEPSTSQPPKAEEKKEMSAEDPDASKEPNPAGGGANSSAGGHGDGSGGDGDADDESDDTSEDGEEDDEEEEEAEQQKEEAEEEMEAPLSLEWPDTRRKQATYLLLLPIVFPLWLTVPDVRNPASRKYFVMTFIASIIWIAVFSYLMVWWAHQVGETVGISEEIMGLTILAAGTSIPDLITSVIVARKGLGDMAVSSSVGSNIFDITVGLPVPWLIFSALHGGAPVAVSSNGLFCAIVLLFLMLLFVIVSIAVCRWRMSRALGLTMFLLYFLFLVLSVLLEDRILTCPVSI